MARLRRVFFMHFGSLIGIITYFTLCGAGEYSAEAVRHALPVALGVHTAYMALAVAAGESKQLDVGLWMLFALGTLGTRVAPDTVLPIYQRYSGVLLFVSLAVAAAVPLFLGRETFTYYYARHQTPAWQQKLPEFHATNRFMTGYWIVLFVIAAGLVAVDPRDWRFSFLLPNLVVVGLGMTAPAWLLPLYARLNPPALPTAIEPLLLGMPWAFDPKAAGTTRASIQFHVSGTDPGDYVLRIGEGRCESFPGTLPAPDVTVHTPDAVWLQIAHGELDGMRALAEGLYRADGDLLLLTRLQEWFPGRR